MLIYLKARFAWTKAVIDNLSHRSFRLGSRLTVNSVIILCILVYGLTAHIRYKIGGVLDFKSIVLLTLFTVCLAKMVITGRINNLRNNKIVFITIFYIFFKIITSKYSDMVQVILVSCILISLLCIDLRSKVDTVRIQVGFVYICSVFLLLVSISVFCWIIVYQSDMILGNRQPWMIEWFSVYEVLFGQIIAFQGLSNDPNLVGNSLVFILFFTLYCIRPRIIAALVVILCILAILLSSSRGSFFALIISLSLSLALIKYRLFSGKLLISVSAVMLGFIGFANYFFALGDKFTRGADRRFFEWGKALSIERNNLLGADVGTISQVLGKHSESGFINLYVEYGLLGLCLFLFVALKAIYVGADSFKSQNALDRVFFSSIVFLFITMVFTSGEISFLLWFGIFWVLQQQGEQKLKPEFKEGS